MGTLLASRTMSMRCAVLWLFFGFSAESQDGTLLFSADASVMRVRNRIPEPVEEDEAEEEEEDAAAPAPAASAAPESEDGWP